MDRIVNILIAEDNPSDVVLFREALESTGWKCILHVARDGMEVLDFLGRRNGHPNAPSPDLILLDHNLPKKTGLEVLIEIRRNPALSNIPLIVFSGSEWERNMVLAFGLPEECYIVKPQTYSGYIEVAKTIEGFWRRKK